MSADPLSDVLTKVRLTGATFFEVTANAPWAAEQPPPETILPRILPGAGHLIAYHVITEGSCFGSILGGEAVPLEAGDVIVFTNGDPHVLSSAPGMRAGAVRRDPLDGSESAQFPLPISYGSDGPTAARIVCGFLACDVQPFNPLLEALPPVMVARSRQGDSDGLAMFARVAMRESSAKSSGGESVLAKLSELMFIEVVRRHLQSLPPDQAGWLAGLRDPFVGRALSLMHGAPAQSWTIDEMARQVGLSRSVLFERFTGLVGTPPMQYLAKWRMQVAAGLLSEGGANLATIAAEVGYASEEAFSRAFKKVVGTSPSIWRRAA